MYIGAKQKKRILLYTIGFIVLIIVLFVSFWINREVSDNFLNLSEPRDVVLSNVREDGVTVTWVTDVKVDGSLVVYKDGSKVGEYKDSREVGKGYIHYVNVFGLQPGITYEFEIISANQKRLNEEGERYEFSTKEVASELPLPNVLRGSVNATNTLVFLIVDDSSSPYPVSTYVGSGGEWFLDLSSLFPIDFRMDTPLKLLFYSNDGVKVMQGNRNALFTREGVFKEVVELDGSENIFAHISNLAKFGDYEPEVKEVAFDTENEEAIDEVLGVEENTELVEEVEEKERETRTGGTLERLDSPSDYGLY